jgi:hypothetical protein
MSQKCGLLSKILVLLSPVTSPGLWLPRLLATASALRQLRTRVRADLKPLPV